MRIFPTLAVSFFVALAACGQAAAPGAADAQTTPAATNAAAAISDADKAAILRGMGFTAANAQGDVMNECGELSTPQYVLADLGGDAGTGILFAMSGGPNTASCYGDGNLLGLFVRDGAGFRQVYSARGRMFVLMNTRTQGVRDVVDGGPGFSFPLWQWDGHEYAYAKREVADSALNDATFLP